MKQIFVLTQVSGDYLLMSTDRAGKNVFAMFVGLSASKMISSGVQLKKWIKLHKKRLLIAATLSDEVS